MNDMKVYDDAVHKFYSSLRLKNLPLVSWDIYGSYFDALCKKYEDIFTLKRLADQNKWSHRSIFEEALLQKGQVIVVTDPQLTIVHATQNIVSMNGYTAKEILGKQPRIFQGPKTSKETTQQLRRAVERRVPFEATLINYRKDGTTYNCWIRGEPIFDESGELVNFIAYEREVA